jgi:phosphoribosylamine--glycine ligase
MLTRSTISFDTESGFAVGIVVTTPPFPYSRDMVLVPVGLPVLFDGDLSPDELRHVHYGEVALQNGMLVTSGASGYTLVVTGMGQTIEAARDAANVLANKVIVANARYRRDIGARLIAGEFAKVEALGLLDP